jgi:hypothetical protein
MYLYNTICGTLSALLIITSYFLQSLLDLVKKLLVHIHHIKNVMYEIHREIRHGKTYKFTLEQTMKAQMMNRGIAQLLL